MERPDPPPPDDAPADDPAAALRRLQERLDSASRTAERLLAEATSAAADALRPGDGPPRPAGGAPPPPERGGPPPSGWQMPRSDEDGERRSEFELLVQAAASLRDLIPPELQSRLAAALRELLLAVRALIDWYLERSERRPPAASEVEDIPIL